MRLYSYLAAEFANSGITISVLRRTITIDGLMHTLKYFYWILPPRSIEENAHPTSHPSGSKNSDLVSTRLERSTIVHIRGYILQIINKLMFSLPSGCEEKDLNRDDEFQSLFNYIATVEEVGSK